MKASLKYKGYAFPDSTAKFDSVFGVAVGYASLPVQELGFTTNLAYMEARKDRSANIARADGNLGYAFNNNVNLKGGLNILKFTSGTDLKDLNSGIGFQGSLGFQLNKTVGFDIGYSESNLSGTLPITSTFTSNGKVISKEVGKGDVDVKLSGLEVGLNATF